MKPAFASPCASRAPACRLIVGDCLEVLPELPAHSVDLVFADLRSEKHQVVSISTTCGPMTFPPATRANSSRPAAAPSRPARPSCLA